MEPLPTLVLSVLMLKHKLHLCHVTAMIIGITGVLFFVFELSNHAETHTETHDTYYGIILTIIWSCGYAIGDIITKKMFIDCFEKDKFIIGGILFYTMQGIVVSVLFCWTLFYPQEININSITMNAFIWITINGCTYVACTVIGYVAIALTSPFYYQIASQLGIPIIYC
eukprot:538957_1